jgi:hypothetical protein
LPDGWVEIINPTARAVDLEGWRINNNGVAESFTFPAGAVIGSGEYVVVDEAAIPGGLIATDIIGMISKFGVVADAAGWGGNVPGTAYARCPDGRGAYVSTTTPTRKAPNACP